MKSTYRIIAAFIINYFYFKISFKFIFSYLISSKVCIILFYFPPKN